MRLDLIRSIDEYRRERDSIVVADFVRDAFDPSIRLSRIGGGSLGGKARGLAFANRLLSEYNLSERFPQLRISVHRMRKPGIEAEGHAT